jgi:hypothetical protein
MDERGKTGGEGGEEGRRGEEKGTHDHLVHQDPERPPIDSRSMAGASDDFWGDVFCNGGEEKVKRK